MHRVCFSKFWGQRYEKKTKLDMIYKNICNFVGKSTNRQYCTTYEKTHSDSISRYRGHYH